MGRHDENPTDGQDNGHHLRQAWPNPIAQAGIEQNQDRRRILKHGRCPRIGMVNGAQIGILIEYQTKEGKEDDSQNIFLGGQ